MLFSEPKIPQLVNLFGRAYAVLTFSALQRAENSSTRRARVKRCFDLRFQCSSASRKFLNRLAVAGGALVVVAFSALQRAENSSTRRQKLRRAAQPRLSVLFSEPKIPQPFPGRDIPAALPTFQCSSASRKFLNDYPDNRRAAVGRGVSVLFSEPKIPQPFPGRDVPATLPTFQCSSASRKFLNNGLTVFDPLPSAVSVLFSEPKIPQRRRSASSANSFQVSVLFSEPKIPQRAAQRRRRR